MPPKNLLGKAAGTAYKSIRHPLNTTGKVVGGTALLGKTVTGYVGKATVSAAAGAVSGVLGRATGSKPAQQPMTGPAPTPEAPASISLRAVPDVNEPAHTAGVAGSAEETMFDVTVEAALVREQPVAKKATPAKKGAARKGAARKVTARKGTARKGTARKDTARKGTARKDTARKGTARKGAARKGAATSAKKVTATPADVADVVEAAVATDPSLTAASQAPTKTPAAKKAAAEGAVNETTPIEPPAPSPEPADLQTPVGTTAAAAGLNPDTAESDLNQPGTENIVEPSTAKEVASESDMLRKAAERNPE